MSLHTLPSPAETATLNTAALRGAFLLQNLFDPGVIRLIPTALDRAIVGSIVPLEKPLPLVATEALRAAYFAERREIGVINLGGSGAVSVEGKRLTVEKLECIYIGRGNREVVFSSDDASAPALFYLVSYPAHTAHPTRRAGLTDANIVSLGSQETANQRRIHQYIHEGPGGIRSCQLVMGFTELATGSVWNTMPPHTHDRRSEVYCYFSIPENHRVLHLMGQPQETRPLWVGNREVVLSPEWSIHCGAGTAAYRFVWAMGGENQRFDDMDAVKMEELK